MSLQEASPARAAESRVPEILAGGLVPASISIIFVLLRFYTRIIITRNWALDDTIILLAWILSVGNTTTNLLTIKHGAGHHAFLQTSQDQIANDIIGFIAAIFYILSLTLTKVGICAFYLRVFRDRLSLRLIYGMIAFIVATGIASTVLSIFQCIPVSGYWDISGHAKCDYDIQSYFTTTTSVLTDLALIAFAVPRILPLKLRRRQKIALLGITSLGLLAIIASVVRLVRFLEFNLPSKRIDLSWYVSDATTFASIELMTGFFCASAPTIRPLLKQVVPKILGSTGGTSNAGAITGGVGSTKNGRYGVGNSFVSRKMRNEGMELESQTELATGKAWAERDSSLEHDVGMERGDRDITKTVTVMISRGV